MNRFSIIVLALATILGGCASVIPGSRVPDRAPLLPAAVEQGMAIGTPTTAWWQALEQPMLDALIVESMDRNRGLQEALAAVQAARAIADEAAREALPQGRLEAQSHVQRPSLAEVDPYREGLPRPPSSRLASLSQGLAWEVDLFGRIGTAAAVVERRADAAAVDLQAASALLQSEVVHHYVGLRLQQQSLRSLAETATVYQTRVQQLRLRVDAGLADRRDLLAAAAERTRVEADSARQRASLHGHLAALAVLAGRSPAERDAWHEALQVPGGLPAVPGPAAILQPANLLARRPDVVRADLELRAALGEAVLAERAHWPRVRFTVGLGLAAPFGDLGDAGALSHVAGPSMSWDWLDSGRSAARTLAARAGAEAALHRFEQTVLTALQESETALREWSAANDVLAEARQAEQLAQGVDHHTRLRVRAGMEPDLVALESTAAQQQAQRDRFAAQADALQSFARTQLALGAWQPGDRVGAGVGPESQPLAVQGVGHD